jgi:hypothetical protein
MKRIYYQKEDFLAFRRNTFLFIDNNALITFIENTTLFFEVVSKLKPLGIELTCIPSVLFEFSRTDSLVNQQKRLKFYNEYIRTYPIEKHLNDFKRIMPVVQISSKNASYPDFLLYCALYKFIGKSYLITSDKDFNLTLLDRKTIITIDNDKQIHNLFIYEMSLLKLNKFIRKLEL